MTEIFSEVILNQIMVRTQRILDVLKVMESHVKQEKGAKSGVTI